VRLAADDLAEIVELALRAAGPPARAALAQIADHGGEGASEVIAGILGRTSPRLARARTRPLSPVAVIERVVPQPAASLDRQQSRRLAAVADGLPNGGGVLFTGPAGAGKTLRARWVAHRRDRPLTTIDLAASADVALARLIDATANATASGMTVHLDHADACDDEALTALVRARLGSGLILIETTEPRAEVPVDGTVGVGLPDVPAIASLLRDMLSGADDSALRVIAALLRGETPRAIEQAVERAHRFAAMTEISVAGALQAASVQRLSAWPPRRRRDVAITLVQTTGLSQRAVQDLTGVSRDTLRRYASTAVG
jgi:SpoVK/Ycf46/Vps4 family AAA+-type ATPase